MIYDHDEGLLLYLVGIVSLKFKIWMKELNMLDLRFGFYVKNYPCGQSPRSKLANPGEHIRKKMFI